MTQDERIIELEDIVKKQGKVTLDYICQHYKISSDSARRDLVKLSQLPHIMRIRGGAILSEKRVETHYIYRGAYSDDKIRLSIAAAKLINERDILFIDAGTTSAALARALPSPVNVITNSIEVLNEVIDKAGVRICILGGDFEDFSHSILGNTTLDQINRYHADKAFIGVSALSEVGITAGTEIDALQKIAMAKQSKKVICITSFSKFNTQLMYKSCCWNDIDHIITDKVPPRNILEIIEKNEVELIIVDNIGG